MVQPRDVLVQLDQARLAPASAARIAVSIALSIEAIRS